jgi:hypothetical protein
MSATTPETLYQAVTMLRTAPSTYTERVFDVFPITEEESLADYSDRVTATIDALPGLSAAGPAYYAGCGQDCIDVHVPEHVATAGDLRLELRGALSRVLY